MKRIILSPSQFKVSNPGYDASTAPDANLTLDAFGAGAFNGVYLAGTSTLVANGTAAAIRTISFGKTFSSVPQAWVRIMSDDGSSVLYDYWNQKAGGNYTQFYTTVNQNSLTVTLNYQGNTFNPFVGFVYVVFQY